MGMSEAERAGMEAEGRQRAWEGFCELPSPRTAAALRLLLGLTPSRAAILAGLPEVLVRDFECAPLGSFPSHDTARRLHRAYAGMGGGWCAPELHDGAYCVTLASSQGAGDREAIMAALALMGHRAQPPCRRVGLETLAGRVAGRLALPLPEVRAELAGRLALPLPEVRAELAGRAPLSDRLRAAAFRELGRGRGGAGAYFRRAEAGGWAVVGCDPAGCWW